MGMNKNILIAMKKVFEYLKATKDTPNDCNNMEVQININPK